MIQILNIEWCIDSILLGELFGIRIRLLSVADTHINLENWFDGTGVWC